MQDRIQKNIEALRIILDEMDEQGEYKDFTWYSAISETCDLLTEIAYGKGNK